MSDCEFVELVLDLADFDAARAAAAEREQKGRGCDIDCMRTALCRR